MPLWTESSILKGIRGFWDWIIEQGFSVSCFVAPASCWRAWERLKAPGDVYNMQRRHLHRSVNLSCCSAVFWRHTRGHFAQRSQSGLRQGIRAFAYITAKAITIVIICFYELLKISLLIVLLYIFKDFKTFYGGGAVNGPHESLLYNLWVMHGSHFLFFFTRAITAFYEKRQGLILPL